MKISQLVEALSKLDPDLEVFIPGYEGGWENISENIEVSSFVKDANIEWYYGPHQKDVNGNIKGITLIPLVRSGGGIGSQ